MAWDCLGFLKEWLGNKGYWFLWASLGLLWLSVWMKFPWKSYLKRGFSFWGITIKSKVVYICPYASEGPIFDSLYLPKNLVYQSFAPGETKWSPSQNIIRTSSARKLLWSHQGCHLNPKVHGYWRQNSDTGQAGLTAKRTLLSPWVWEQNRQMKL